MACSGISSASGIFMVFFLGSFLSWRQVAFICAIIPISSIIAVFFVRLKFIIFVLSFSDLMIQLKTLEISRFQKHQFGFYPEIDRKMH